MIDAIAGTLCALAVLAGAPAARGESANSAAPAATSTPADAIAPAPDPFVRHARQVADRIWLIYKSKGSLDAPFEGNVTVVEQSAGLVVVDAGGCPLSGRHVVERIRAISKKPVRFLVYTHYHGDHNLGAGAFLAAWPALTILSTEATRANMVGPAMAYARTYDQGYQGTLDHAKRQFNDASTSPAMRAGWGEFIKNGPSMVAAYRGMSATPATATFTDRVVLHDEAAPIELRFLGRANTDGDAVAWMPRQRVVAAGDIVVHPTPYAAATYPREWIEALGRLKALDYAFLIPGHGEVQTDHAYLDKLIGALEDVRARVAPLAAQGLAFDEARKRWDFSELRSAFAGDDEWRRFLLDVFFLGAVVQNAWKEARGEPIVQGKDGG